MFATLMFSLKTKIDSGDLDNQQVGEMACFALLSLSRVNQRENNQSWMSHELMYVEEA